MALLTCPTYTVDLLAVSTAVILSDAFAESAAALDAWTPVNYRQEKK